MNCPNCGQAMLTGARFCNNCGTEISADEDRSPAPDAHTILDSEPVPYLLITTGPGRGQTFDLRGEVHLGRSRTNAVALFDGKVSRSHAKLDPIRNTYIVTDLGSANGTFVNGVRITQPMRLRDGDLLQVGDTQLVFHIRSSSSQDAQVASHPRPPSVPPADPGSLPSSSWLPIGKPDALPTWIWAGCVALIIVIGLLMIVILAMGILIGQGLVGGA